MHVYHILLHRPACSPSLCLLLIMYEAGGALIAAGGVRQAIPARGARQASHQRPQNRPRVGHQRPQNRPRVAGGRLLGIGAWEIGLVRLPRPPKVAGHQTGLMMMTMTGQVAGAVRAVLVVVSTGTNARRETGGGGSWRLTVKLIRNTLKQIRTR